MTCLAAWDDGCPIGYVHVGWPGRSQELTNQAVELGCCEVGDLFVSDRARGRGVGRALMVAAEELVRARGEDLIGLEVTASILIRLSPVSCTGRWVTRRRGLGISRLAIRIGTLMGIPTGMKRITATSSRGCRLGYASLVARLRLPSNVFVSKLGVMLSFI